MEFNKLFLSPLIWYLWGPFSVSGLCTAQKTVFSEAGLTSLCSRSACQHNLQEYRVQFIECAKALV